MAALSPVLSSSPGLIRFPGSPRTARPAGLMHLGLLYYDLVDIMVIADEKYVLQFLDASNAITTAEDGYSLLFLFCTRHQNGDANIFFATASAGRK
jgi:hypothetical protein